MQALFFFSHMWQIGILLLPGNNTFVLSSNEKTIFLLKADPSASGWESCIHFGQVRPLLYRRYLAFCRCRSGSADVPGLKGVLCTGAISLII